MSISSIRVSDAAQQSAEDLVWVSIRNLQLWQDYHTPLSDHKHLIKITLDYLNDAMRKITQVEGDT